MKEIQLSKIKDIVSGEAAKYSYLFPYRDDIPILTSSPFQQLNKINTRVDKFVINTMLDPAYIGWTVKVLLNIDLFPMQIAILQTLLDTTFPLFVGSRGCSKSFLLAIYSILKALFENNCRIVIVGAGLRQAKIVFNYIQTIWTSAPILRDLAGGAKYSPKQAVDQCRFSLGSSTILALPMGDGCVNSRTQITHQYSFGTISDDQPKDQKEKNIISRHGYIYGKKDFVLSDESYCNGEQATKIITTRKGYNIEGTYNHKLNILRDGNFVWVHMDEMRPGDRILINRKPRWHKGETSITPDAAYACGLMVGDGSYVRKDRMGFATQDLELAEAVKQIINIKQCSSDPVHWTIYKKQQRQQFLDRFGITEYKTKDKIFPTEIMKSQQEVMTGFIQGLFDSDGHIQVTRKDNSVSCVVGFTNTSKRLVEQLHYILLHYGIISTVRTRDRTDPRPQVKNQPSRVYELLITGQDAKIFADKINFRLGRKRDKLNNALSEKKRDMTLGDGVPHVKQLMADVSQENRTKWGTSTKETTATSAAKIRQRKIVTHSLINRFLSVYGNIEDLRIDTIRKLNDPDIYYDEIKTIQESRCITFDMHVPGSHTYTANGFISHNTKIRGFRASTVIADEIACLSSDSFITYKDKFGNINDYFIDNTCENKTQKQINEQIWGNGKFNKSDIAFYNGVYETKKIKTRCGYEIEGTHNHKIKILHNKKIQWIRMDNIKNGDVLLIDREFRWHEGTTSIIPDEAYACGLLVGDGYYGEKSHSMEYCTYDKELGDAIQVLGHFKQRKTKFHTYILNGGKNKKYDILDKFEMRECIGKDKCFPENILKSDRETVSAFIQGLFDTDGCFHASILSNGCTTRTVSFSNISRKLIYQLQYILLHYGITCSIRKQIRNKKNYNDIYHLTICGINIYKFYKYIGFRLKRKQNLLIEFVKNKKIWKCNNDYIPGVIEDIYYIFDNYKQTMFPSKTFNKSLFKKLKNPCRTTVKKFLKAYSHVNNDIINRIRMLTNDNIYYDVVKNITDNTTDTYDIHIPDTHEYCANGFFSHNSIPSEIFDIVVRGFASTSRTPVDTAKQLAKIKKLKAFGLNNKAIEELVGDVTYGNQIIYSGTAYYAFNHFAKKHAMWKRIIESRGDEKKINDIFGSEFAVPDNFNWKDYAIIRLPYTHVHEGLMDQKQLAQAKAVLPRNIFLMEYCAVFVSDSNGVFPRSLIERCTPTPSEPIQTNYGNVLFSPEMHGDKNAQYVMGVDPAAQQDHFAIVMLKVGPNDTRIVNCWSVNKKEFDKRKQNGLVTSHDYYAYCCSKILWFVKRFNVVRIEMDSQGGGYSISEMLRNKRLIDKDEKDFPIYEIIDDKNMTDFDGLSDGPHIISLVKPTSEWNAESNRTMHKSFETIRLLFPAFNPIKMQAALIVEKSTNITVDTYEDCVNEIEELKNEICNIQITETKSGKEKFETLEASSQPGSDRTIIHKDRYSALLLAHAYVNSLLSCNNKFIDYNDIAGNMDLLPINNNDLYYGPGMGRMKNSQYYQNGCDPFGSLKNGEIQY